MALIYALVAISSSEFSYFSSVSIDGIPGSIKAGATEKESVKPAFTLQLQGVGRPW